MREDFAVFIPSYKRANSVVTIEALRKAGYTGKIYIVCDDTDDQIEEYKANYENVLVFSKREYADKFDLMDNFHRMNTDTYAHHAMYDFAKELGIEYFCSVDDDFRGFHYRILKHGKMCSLEAKNFDTVFEEICNILDIPSVYSVGFSFDGAFFGGREGIYKDRVVCNCFGLYVMKRVKRIEFSGTFNWDMNALCSCQKVGKCLLSTTDISISTFVRSENDGGLHDCYSEGSDYISNSYMINFYSLMVAPSALTMRLGRHGRIALKKNNSALFPKILSEAVKK